MPAKRSLFTRALAFVGLQRKPAQRSIFAGAAGGRLNADWIMGATSADAEIKADGRRLRDRARELRRDDALAARFVRLQVHGILGPEGVKLRAVVPNSRGATNSAVSTAIETGWRQWGAAETCDVAGRLAWPDIERLQVETWKTEGEAYLQMIDGADNRYGFALQLFDPDQVDDQYNVAASNGRNAVVMGVEVDAVGRRVAYHIWTAHPSDGTARVRRRVPAADIVQITTPMRVGQTRGVTPLAPVMQTLRQVGRLQEALVILMRTAACKMGFFVPNERYEAPIEAPAGQTNLRMDAEPGLIDQVPNGFDFASWDPGQPGDAYAPFTLDAKRDIAAGLDVSHAALTGNLAEANYGSQRVGMTLEREGYKRDAAYLTRTMHDVVFARWLRSAVLYGAINVPAQVAMMGSEVAEWQARAFDWIDPIKDIDAALAEVNAGLNSLTRIAASKGRDFADLVAERKAEQALAASAGVTLTLSKNAPPALPPGAPTDEQAREMRLVRAVNG